MLISISNRLTHLTAAGGTVCRRTVEAKPVIFERQHNRSCLVDCIERSGNLILTLNKFYSQVNSCVVSKDICQLHLNCQLLLHSKLPTPRLEKGIMFWIV